MFNVIIFADKYFENYQLLKEKCNFYLSKKNKDEVTILDPCENKLVSLYAAEMGYKVTPIKADWKKYQERSFKIRNEKLTDLGNALIAFKSETGYNKGLQFIKNIAEGKNLLVRIIKEDESGDFGDIKKISSIVNSIKESNNKNNPSN